MSIGEILKKLKKNILFLLFAILVCITFFSVKKVVAISNEKTHFIYIDAGHGGFDGGATSLDKTIIEKDITLKVCLYLEAYFKKTGLKVKLTRSKDEALAKSKRDDILKRVSLINDSACDIYISIHANAYPSSLVKGAQTFYNKNLEDNLLLASKIMNYLYLVDSTNKRVPKDISGKYLLDNTQKVGCLVELGFLTNESDLEKLTDDEQLRKISLMIYLGILEYLEEKGS